MAHDGASRRIVRGRRLALYAVSVAVAAGAVCIHATVERLRERAREVRTLRGRLADKLAQVGRQREELGHLADALERLTRTSAALRERAGVARRVANLAQSREPEPLPIAEPLLLDGGAAVASEEGARALQQLAVLEADVSSAVETLGVIPLLLRERPRKPVTPTTPLVGLLWPVRGQLTGRFGERRGGEDGHVHAGIDIQGADGTPILASGDGAVVFADRDAGYGNLVVIDHGDQIETYYAHLSAMYVRVGQRLRRGAAVGAMGQTGRATGVHCHFEVRVAGRPVDPHRWLADDADHLRADASPRLIPVGARAIEAARRAGVSSRLVGP